MRAAVGVLFWCALMGLAFVIAMAWKLDRHLRRAALFPRKGRVDHE